MKHIALRKKALCAASVVIAVGFCTSASTYIVKGIVRDAIDGSPCPATVVRVYAASDSILPAITILTDSIGQFEAPLDTVGRYKLKAEFMGGESESREFVIDESSEVIDLDTIGINSQSSTLEEYVVSVKKPLVENDGATLTYNMSEDPMAEGNSLLEMLRKVPMVTVDAEENIKVRGSSNFKIYLNSREDPMLSGDPKTILKSMPASTVKKIEVITEPGARYDAEGTGGILNIVTVTKTNLAGVLGNLSAWVNKNSTGASAYARAKTGNVTASANISGNHSIWPDGSSYTSIYEVENKLSESDRRQRFDGKGSSDFSYIGGGFDLSWEPDTLNLFTVNFNAGENKNSSSTLQDITGFDADDEMIYSMVRHWTNANKNLWINSGASFQHNFKTDAHYIVGSYQYSFYNSNNQSLMETKDYVNYAEQYPWRLNQNATHQNNHTLQLDYSNSLDSHNTLEAGAKYMRMRSDAKSSPLYGTSEEDMKIREDEVVDMAQFRNVAALYVSHKGSYGKWSTRVGLRYENTELGLKYFSTGYEDFTSHLNDWVPDVSVTYRLTGIQNFRLAYQMRIRRPSIYELNPYVNTMTIGQQTYGNPDLDSEHNNNVSLTYSNYGGKVGGSIRARYSVTANQIAQYSFSDGSLVNYTYANIGNYQSFGLSGDIQIGVVNNLNISLSGSLSYDKYKADTELLRRKRHGWDWFYNANVDYRLPFGLSLSAYGGQGNGYFDLESSGSGWYYYGMSASKGFLKNETLRLTIYGQNFLNPHRVSTYSSAGDNTSSFQNYRMSQWYAGISISWRFGSLSDDVKRTNSRLESESNGGGGNSGGGR